MFQHSKCLQDFWKVRISCQEQHFQRDKLKWDGNKTNQNHCQLPINWTQTPRPLKQVSPDWPFIRFNFNRTQRFPWEQPPSRVSRLWNEPGKVCRVAASFQPHKRKQIGVCFSGVLDVARTQQKWDESKVRRHATLNPPPSKDRTWIQQGFNSKRTGSYCACREY